MSQHNQLLLPPSLVHSLSDVVYRADFLFRDTRKMNPTASVASVRNMAAARLGKELLDIDEVITDCP